MNPDPLALSALLKPLVKRHMLCTIAAADYSTDIAEHLAALERLHKQGKPDSHLTWHPKEVLALTRWSEPELTKPGSTDPTGHIIREFCCTTLMQASADPANDGFIEGENQTAALLIASALHLGPEHVKGARQLLAWWVLSSRNNASEAATVMVGVLVLTAALALPNESHLVQGIIDGVVALEFDGRKQWRGRYPQAKRATWLWGLTCFNQCQSHWNSLVATHLANPPAAWPSDICNEIRQLAAVLLGNAPPESIGSISPVFE